VIDRPAGIREDAIGFMATTSISFQSDGREMGWPFSLVVAADHEAMSRCAADAVLAAIERTPGLLIGAATGSTPTRMYEMLVERGQREPRLVAGIRILKIDEWGGLAMDDPATCEVYLREKLLTPLAVSEDRYLGWNSAAADPQAECGRVGRWARMAIWRSTSPPTHFGRDLMWRSCRPSRSSIRCWVRHRATRAWD
jgi:hypothetical protein